MPTTGSTYGNKAIRCLALFRIISDDSLLSVWVKCNDLDDTRPMN